jgi:hypothetical protein
MINKREITYKKGDVLEITKDGRTDLNGKKFKLVGTVQEELGLSKDPWSDKKSFNFRIFKYYMISNSPTKDQLYIGIVNNERYIVEHSRLNPCDTNKPLEKVLPKSSVFKETENKKISDKCFLKKDITDEEVE